MQFYAKRLPAIDPKRPEEALRTLEAHINYLQEQTDNAIAQLRREAGLPAGHSSELPAQHSAGTARRAMREEA